MFINVVVMLLCNYVAVSDIPEDSKWPFFITITIYVVLNIIFNLIGQGA